MPKDKKNIYECPAGHLTVTEDRDEGVTPMFMECKRPGCNRQSASMMYNVPQFLTAEYEWYKPNPEDVKPYEQEHVSKGGLLLREIPEADRKPVTIQQRLAQHRGKNEKQ
jgi:hypothetical protein